MSTFKFTLRIPYAQTDQMGVVYYANYFIWYEQARTEFFRALGTSYKDLENKNIYFPVVESFCKYIRPVKYDEEIEVITQLSELKNASIRFSYEVRNKGEVFAIGFTKHACVNEKGNTCRIPEFLEDILYQALV